MELLTTQQVSEITGIPEGTLRYYRANDRGPRSGKLGGRAVRYRRSDVEDWIKSQMDDTARGGRPQEVA